jgi:nucleoside-diphosphate kinase
MQERTLIIIKPDAVQRQIIGRIIDRLEMKGFRLTAAKMIHISLELAQKHYQIHKNQPFFDRLCRYISSSPSLIMVWQGENIIKLSRNLMGETLASQACPGTIRGDFSTAENYNIVHGSDSPESAEFEISLFFKEEEIVDYELTIEPWLSGTYHEKI